MKIEALKHTEWVLGIFFIWFALFDLEFTPWWILITIFGSQIPDFLELLLIRLKWSRNTARKISHDYAIVLLIWIIVPFNLYPELDILTTAIAVHYVIDLFSGLEPIYLAGLIFGERTAILYVTAEHRIAIGKRIDEWGSNYLRADTEDPTPELAWFWIMQLSGTIFCGIGAIIYLSF